ncbi:MAG TPA: SRPBCC family protein [Candidatus Polarisedimenticolaceae bacterium]|nr:SRPBCC family protein [Candidatus Polarisedimenticolaceae bacterium]
MRVVRASLSAVIRAPSQAVYALIADYREGHGRMLPAKHFPRLEVESGGVGAGTIILFEVRLLGSTRRVRAEVSEPKPGEELVETDLATGARTSFLVVPRAAGRESEVTIQTEWEAKGVRGWIEGMLVPPVLRRIYADELSQLRSLFAVERAGSGQVD